MRTESDMLQALADAIKWYTGATTRVRMSNGEPTVYINDLIDEVAWWIAMELVFGETCGDCWCRAKKEEHCTRECFVCWDGDAGCSHHGAERWPSPGHRQDVLVKMMSEVVACL